MKERVREPPVTLTGDQVRVLIAMDDGTAVTAWTVAELFDCATAQRKAQDLLSGLERLGLCRTIGVDAYQDRGRPAKLREITAAGRRVVKRAKSAKGKRGAT